MNVLQAVREMAESWMLTASLSKGSSVGADSTLYHCAEKVLMLLKEDHTVEVGDVFIRYMNDPVSEVLLVLEKGEKSVQCRSSHIANVMTIDLDCIDMYIKDGSMIKLWSK